MVGKLTKDNQASCSILATILGENPWKTREEQLRDCISANDGNVIRFEQNSIMRMGDILENPILLEARKRLGLDHCNVNIDHSISHPTLPLEGSLDGLIYKDKFPEPSLTIKENINEGIYVMNDAKEITVEGEGVMECKATSVYPEDVPPAYRGVTQMQGLMDCLGASYGVLVILYQSVHLRIFVYPRNEEMVANIHTAVIDFDRRIQEKDYYPPENSKDASIVYPNPNDEHLDMKEEALDFIDLYQQAKKSIKHWQNIKDSAQLSLMGILQENTSGSVKTNDTTYVVKWGNRTIKPKPEKIVKAESGYTVRSNSITIKEVSNEIQL